MRVEIDPRSPPPGIYARHELVYTDIVAINQSLLKHMGRSPLHFRAALDAPRAPTVPMRLGQVAHCAVLEPDDVDRYFAVYEPEAGKKDAFKGKHYEAALADALAHGRELIKRAEHETALRIAAAVRSNELAARYFRAGLAEPILVWRDEITGLLCKARLDWISTSVPDVMAELKTAADVSPWRFSAQFAKLGYYMQAAFYADGYKAITGRELYGKCVAVESALPHDVIVYDLAEVVDAGREDYRKLLTRLAECRAANLWPGQSPDRELTLELPRWLTEDDESDAIDALGLEGWDADGT